MGKCVDAGKFSYKCSTRVVVSRGDGKPRCQRHSSIYMYGFCTERHPERVPATGKDNLCRSHRNGRYSKIVLDVGDVNEFGVKVIDGPIKKTTRWRWGYQCPICNGRFENDTARFKQAKSCYDCRGILLRKSSSDITWTQLYQLLLVRKHSKEKGCDITKEEFVELSSKDCHYCGGKPTPSKGHREWATYVLTNGLDRVDSSMGYLRNNVVPCCRRCNVAKLDDDVEEFYKWAERIAKRQESRRLNETM